MSNKRDMEPSLDYFELRRRHEEFKNSQRQTAPKAQPEASEAPKPVKAAAKPEKAEAPAVVEKPAAAPARPVRPADDEAPVELMDLAVDEAQDFADEAAEAAHEVAEAGTDALEELTDDILEDDEDGEDAEDEEPEEEPQPTGKPLDLRNRNRQQAAPDLVPGRDYDPDTGEVYETAGQSADGQKTTGRSIVTMFNKAAEA